MATVIRLARFGAKKRPYYHVVVTDSRNARNSGNVLEVVGKYDPMLPRDNEKRVVLKIDEIKSWLAKGAKPSPLKNLRSTTFRRLKRNARPLTSRTTRFPRAFFPITEERICN